MQSRNPEDATLHEISRLLSVFKRCFNRVEDVHSERPGHFIKTVTFWDDFQQSLESLKQSTQALSAAESGNNSVNTIEELRIRQGILHSAIISDLDALQNQDRILKQMIEELSDHHECTDRAENELRKAYISLLSAYRVGSVVSNQHHPLSRSSSV